MHQNPTQKYRIVVRCVVWGARGTHDKVDYRERIRYLRLPTVTKRGNTEILAVATDDKLELYLL